MINPARSLPRTLPFSARDFQLAMEFSSQQISETFCACSPTCEDVVIITIRLPSGPPPRSPFEQAVLFHLFFEGESMEKKRFGMKSDIKKNCKITQTDFFFAFSYINPTVKLFFPSIAETALLSNRPFSISRSSILKH